MSDFHGQHNGSQSSGPESSQPHLAPQSDLKYYEASPSIESRSQYRSNDASDDVISNSEAEDSSLHSTSRRQKRERPSDSGNSLDSANNEPDICAPKRRPTASKWEDNDTAEKDRKRGATKSNSQGSKTSQFQLDSRVEQKLDAFTKQHSSYDEPASAPAVGPSKPAETDDLDPFSIYGYPDPDEAEVGGPDALPPNRHGTFLPSTPPASTARSTSTPPIPAKTYGPRTPPRPATPPQTPPRLLKVAPQVQNIPHVFGNFFTGCRNVEDAYDFIRKIGDGTYGTVYKARNRATNQIVALKKVKLENEKEGFPLISLREIKVLMQSHHPNVVNALEIVVGPEGTSFFIVMEYLEHDLHSLMEDKGKPFTLSEVKLLMYQLIGAVEHLHAHWIFHRDIKTSNLLYSNKNGVLKLCDMGLAREFYDPPRPLTPNVVTLWYRAPEVLLGMPQYGESIDIWSVGCIFGELLDNKPMFDGKGELDQLRKIFALLGSPNGAVWPEYPEFMKSKGLQVQDTNKYNHLKSRYPQISQTGFDLMNRMLAYNPSMRITAAEALKHPWFSERPLPKEPHLMPTFPSRSDGGRPQSNQRRELSQDAQQSIALQEQQHVFGAHERHYERG